MLFAIISAVLAYRKANDTGRNGWLWAIIAAAVFIGTQLVVALFLGVALGVYFAATDRPDTDFEKYNLVLTIISVVCSFGTTFLLLKYLDRRPPDYTEPPPPPNFTGR